MFTLESALILVTDSLDKILPYHRASYNAKNDWGIFMQK